MQISEISHWFKEDRILWVGTQCFSQDYFGSDSKSTGGSWNLCFSWFIFSIYKYNYICSGVVLQCLITHCKHRYFIAVGEKY